LKFQDGSRQGILIYDQINHIQAYLSTDRGTLTLAEFVPLLPIFILPPKLNSTPLKFFTYKLLCSDLQGGETDFKVYLSPSLKGGGFSEQEVAELELANQFCRSGTSLYNEGKLAEALNQYQKSLAIRERLAPNSLDVAMSYNNIGNAYLSQGKLAEALNQYQKSLAIRERFAPNSLDVAMS